MSRAAATAGTTANTCANTAAVPSLHPLLFDACRCGQNSRMRCLVCLRWHRHHRMVVNRRKAWGAA